MKLTGAMLIGMLSLLPLTMGHDAGGNAPANVPVEAAPPTSVIDPIFRDLVETAQQVADLLSEVTDKESADRIAAPLKEKLAFIKDKLHTLESYPLNEERDAEALKQHMAALTHVSQNTLNSIQLLVELNAYGSEALMEVFNRYKVDTEKIPHLQADDVPHGRIYSDLADLLDDVLYTLRKVQDGTSAQAALATLSPLLRKMEQSHHMLVQLAPPLTDEQREAVRPSRERLLKLSGELKEEISRLQAAHCFHIAELDSILPRLLQSTSI